MWHKLSQMAKMSMEQQALPTWIGIIYLVFEVCDCLVDIAIACAAIYFDAVCKGIHWLYLNAFKYVVQVV